MNKDKTIDSICIPRIDTTVTKEYIFGVLCKLKIGCIEKINEIPLRNDSKHKRIIIKMRWNESDNSINIQKRLLDGEIIKLVYDMPWYWKILATHRQK